MTPVKDPPTHVQSTEFFMAVNLIMRNCYIKGDDYDVFSGQDLVMSVRESVARWRSFNSPGSTSLTICPHSITSVAITEGAYVTPRFGGVSPSVTTETANIIASDARTSNLFLPNGGFPSFAGAAAAVGPPALSNMICELGDALCGDKTCQYMTPAQLTSNVVKSSSRWVRYPSGLFRDGVNLGPINASLISTGSIQNPNNVMQFIAVQVPDQTNVGYVYQNEFSITLASPTGDAATGFVVGFALLDDADVVANRASMSLSRAVFLTKRFRCPGTAVVLLTTAGLQTCIQGSIAGYFPDVNINPGVSSWYAVVGFESLTGTPVAKINCTAYTPSISQFVINGATTASTGIG